jgi:hypothetical protein
VSDFSERSPTWIELESIVTLQTAAKITSLSTDTLRRNYPNFVVQLSLKRHGMKLRHALAIASGTARTEAAE